MLRNIISKFPQNRTNVNLCQRWTSFTRASTFIKAVSEAPNIESADNYVLQQEHIEEAIKTNPILSNFPQDRWHSTHTTFINHGISTFNFLRIVTVNPKVLTRSTKNIMDIFETWRSCQFGEYFLFLLLTKYPFMFNIDNKRQLLKQTSFLQSYFSTNKNVWKLLMNCPTLVCQPIPTIEEKIVYLKNTMRIEIPEIIKSEALEKSIDDIKCRHVFLERLGLFKRRSLKADPDEKSKNPRLYKITDTSEKTFATKLCHVTFNEFEAFKELYVKELKRIEEEQDLQAEEDFKKAYKKIS